MIDQERLLERFLRYVQIDTTAREGAATLSQFARASWSWGGMLADELRAMGLADAGQTGHGHRAGHGSRRPSGTRRAGRGPQRARRYLAGNHAARASEPQVVADYAGGDIVAAGRSAAGDPRGRQPRAAIARRPHAHHHRRHDAVGRRRQGGRGRHHGDGRLAASSIPRSRTARCGSASPATRRSATASITSIWQQIGAAVCYTLDGHGSGRDRRRDVFGRPGGGDGPRREHPPVDRQGADGQRACAWRPISSPACRATCCRPRRPSGREGFLHPYEIEGGVAEVTMRDSAPRFRRGEARRAGRAAAQRPPRAERAVSRREDRRGTSTPQYRNMAEGLAREPRAVAYAEQALERLGRTAAADDRPRRHRRLAADRAGPADAQSLARRTQSAFAAGMGLSGGDGSARSKCSSSWCRLWAQERAVP